MASLLLILVPLLLGYLLGLLQGHLRMRAYQKGLEDAHRRSIELVLKKEGSFSSTGSV